MATRTTTIKYAWQVLRDGKPTSIVITLTDESDVESLVAVRAAAEENGVELEPIPLDSLTVEDERLALRAEDDGGYPDTFT